jgi:23S rRNA (cytosine1962-C5)-methyltransferase
MPAADPGMLVNRLVKNYRHLSKWAKREQVSCFRIYDADIPEFPLAIDLYEHCLHVAEYRRKHKLSPEEYRAWRDASIQAMTTALNIPADNIFFKEREPQKGFQQYDKYDERRAEIIVNENGLSFVVNLSDYLDTGLFLDHRPLRKRVREQAAGKDILNLFAYTGSFSVYAAAGGAASVTTIDLSNTYLDWARRNFTVNKLLDPSKHHFIRADVKAWLRQQPTKTYDLIILDPPTFSNSKAMTDILDTQRDHVELINRCLARLRPNGTLFFSTNYRKFRLEPAEIQTPLITDISKYTIPPDFRNDKIHYCYQLDKAPTPVRAGR